jgi:hypothetical protein
MSPRTAVANERDAEAVRCQVTLTGPEDFSIQVPGWGSTDKEGLQAADSAARYLAEMHRMVDAWTVILFSEDTQDAVGLERLEAVKAQWSTLNLAGTNRFPGYEIGAGSCSPAEAPKNKKWRWTVGWGEARIDGVELGPTMERVRRRACGRDFQRKRMSLFHAAAGASVTTRSAGFRAGLNVAFNQLSSCYLAEDTLSIATSHRKARRVEADSSLFVCIGEPPSLSSGGQIPVRLATPAGVSTTIEGAAEAAWSEWRVLVHRRALAFALYRSIHLSSAQRLQGIAQAFTQTFEDIGASAKLEDAVTWCWVVPEQTPKVWSWDTTGAKSFQWCKLDGESTVLSETALSGFELTERREDLCMQQAWSGVELLNRALQNASEEVRQTLLFNGWSMMLGCESACLMGSSLGSQDFRPVDLGGFESEQEAWEALDDAITSGEVGQIAAIIPDVATSQGLELLLVEEQAFLDGLREAMEQATLHKIFEAQLNKGRWTIRIKENPGSIK